MQDVDCFEWIVVDGASTDGTPEWLASLEDRWVHWSSEQDDGLYDAMNRGLARARGQLIAFLNAGDTYVRPDVLGDVARDFAQRSWLWGHGCGYFVDASGQPVRPVISGYRGRIRYAFGRTRLIHSTVFAATSLLKDLGGFDCRFPIAADVHLLMRVGRVAQPREWKSVDVAFEVGGVSDQDVRRSLNEVHRARIDVFEMSVLAAMADSLWTEGIIAYVRARQVAKRVVRGVLGQRVITWWAQRGLP